MGDWSDFGLTDHPLQALSGNGQRSGSATGWSGRNKQAAPQTDVAAGTKSTTPGLPAAPARSRSR